MLTYWVASSWRWEWPSLGSLSTSCLALLAPSPFRASGWSSSLHLDCLLPFPAAFKALQTQSNAIFYMKSYETTLFLAPVRIKLFLPSGPRAQCPPFHY